MKRFTFCRLTIHFLPNKDECGAIIHFKLQELLIPHHYALGKVLHYIVCIQKSILCRIRMQSYWKTKRLTFSCLHAHRPNWQKATNVSCDTFVGTRFSQFELAIQFCCNRFVSRGLQRNDGVITKKFCNLYFVDEG